MNNNQNNYVAIMAGGVGSRFYPSSRAHYPKQFLDMLGMGKSLLQLTVERFAEFIPKNQILIVTNSIYKDIVQQQLADFSPEQILCEPSRNNTAPCVAYTAFHIAALNPNANFVVAPSDHVILKQAEFSRHIQTALQFAAQHEALLTLGIQPHAPNTGYGYIHFDKHISPENGIFKVNRFTEKPNLETATQFIQSGEYLWNAGIFVWNVQTILKALQLYSPSIYNLFNAGKHFFGTDSETDFINKNYPKAPNISIDYAVMEKADNIYTSPADIGWSDLGTWASLYHELDKDENGNAFSSLRHEQILLENCQNNIIRASQDKVTIIRDLENYIVVDEPDALLIYPKSAEQDIKKVVANINDNLPPKFL
jgi:mannose-1-phosphate guanylyltransferase